MMAKTYYGDPNLVCRMPAHYITALQMLARQQGTTVSEIVRSLVADELKARGFRLSSEPLPGQMRIE